MTKWISPVLHVLLELPFPPLRDEILLLCCSSVPKLCPTLGDPMDCSVPVSFALHYSWSLLKFIYIELVMLSNHLNHCCPILFLPPIFPSIRVFSNESVLCIRWTKYWSLASASLIPMNVEDWFFFLGLTDLILQLKGFSRIFSNTTIQKHQFFGAQLSL